MGEVGQQLVKNERARGRCRADALQCMSRIVTLVSFGDEQGLAELDPDKVAGAVRELLECKQRMRKLRAEYKELAGLN